MDLTARACAQRLCVPVALIIPATLKALCYQVLRSMQLRQALASIAKREGVGPILGRR